MTPPVIETGPPPWTATLPLIVVDGPWIVTESPWLVTLPVTTVPAISVQLPPLGTVTFWALPSYTPLQVALPPPNGLATVQSFSAGFP